MGTVIAGALATGVNSIEIDSVKQGIASAWLNFRDLESSTAAIITSHNISSIVDEGKGIYTINFETAMKHANYCCVCGAVQGASAYGATSANLLVESALASQAIRTTTSIRLVSVDNNGDTYFNAFRGHVTILGGHY